MKIGAHLSISGGISRAVRQAARKNLDCLQIFSGSPRTWQIPTIGEEEIKNFQAITKKYRLSPIFIHAKYLVNPASDDSQTTKRSIESLIIDLKIAGKIGAQGVIFHPRLKNLPALIKNIHFIIKQTPAGTDLILEASAQTKISHLAELVKRVNLPRVKVCLDTAHVFESGLDLNNSGEIERLFIVLEKQIGFEKLALIHTNNSKTSFGSKHDVHADLNKGMIDKSAFFILTNHVGTKNKPFILETPSLKENHWEPTKENINFLKRAAGRRLGEDFFSQPTIKVAKDLLGKYLVVRRGGRFQVGRIKETEAYVGQKDLACHAARGKTARTRVMFASPGRLYIYLIYGRYHCLNVVTEKKGFPAAVLIRAVEPIFGIRGNSDGPGRLCRELGLTRAENDRDITKDKEVYIKDVGERPEKIKALPRVGVDYAGEWAKKKWRFIASFPILTETRKKQSPLWKED